MNATSPLTIQTNAELNARLARRAEPRAALVPAESAWERKLRAKLEQKPREADPDRPESNHAPAKAASRSAAGTDDPADKTPGADASQAGPEVKQPQDGDGRDKDAQPPSPEGQAVADAHEADAETAAAVKDRTEESAIKKQGGPDSASSDTTATTSQEQAAGADVADRPITIAELNAALATLDATVLPTGLLQDLGLLRGPSTVRVAQKEQQSPGGDALSADGADPQPGGGSGAALSIASAQTLAAPPAGEGTPSAEALPRSDRKDDAPQQAQAPESGARRVSGPGERPTRSKADASIPAAAGVSNVSLPEPKAAAAKVIDRLESLVGPPRPFVLESAKAAPPAAGRTPIDESAFQAQLARGLGAAMQQDDGQVTLRLNPEQLGSLKIDVSVDRSDVSLRFEAGTRQAAELIDRALPELRRSLEDKGLVVREASVHVSDAAAPDAREPVRAGQDAPSGWSPGGGGGSLGEPGGSMDPGGRGSAGSEGGADSRWRQDRPAEGPAAVEPAIPAFGAVEQGWGDGVVLRLNALA